jgi:hypothetical protein
MLQEELGTTESPKNEVCARKFVSSNEEVKCKTEEARKPTLHPPKVLEKLD